MDGYSLSFRSKKDFQTNQQEPTHFESLKDLSTVENIFNSSENREIICDNPKSEFKNFKKHFTFIKAAGGIVEHENKYLFIYRLGKWDLPKGKMDEGEKPKITALREIEEECNLHGHAIVSKLCNTYHTYELKNQAILKKTYWYYLTISNLNDSDLKPQTEEGITDVRWFGIDDFDEIRKNAYDSIHEVLDAFLKMKSFERA